MNEITSEQDMTTVHRIADRYVKNLHHATNFEKVAEFMKVMGQHCPEHPQMASEGVEVLRLSLIQEEFNELQEGIIAKDLVAIADAISDLLYVVYGAAVAYGIDADQCFAEVHRSNMSKLGDDNKPMYREDGKVLKSSRYTPPNLVPILFPDHK